MITAETEADAQDLVKISHTSERPEMTRGPMSFLWWQTDMEFPWNIDYSGKKRRKKRERKRILRDYLLRWKWLKSLELAQLSVLLSEEMGSWELNLISAKDKENSIPEHLDSCTVKSFSHCTYFDYSSSNSKLHVFCVIYAFNCTNYKLWKKRKRDIFWSLCEGSPTILLSECMSLLECELTCVSKPFPSFDQFLRASHRVKISPNWTWFYCWRYLTFKIQNAC